jgi:ubiquinone/menaquinone biosynthesis C-methylase UbiE
LSNLERPDSNRNSVLSAFDSLARDYDKWYNTPLGSMCDYVEREAIFFLTDIIPGMEALDVSCGTGNYALELARQGADVTAVDLSEAMLEIAKTKAKREGIKVSFAHGLSESLPFPEATFDIVTCVLGLEFVTSRVEAFREMFRVLKPQGQLVIGTLGKYNAWAVLRRLKGLFFNSIWKRATFFNKKEIQNLALSQGRIITGWRSAIFFPPLNWSWFLYRFRHFEKLGQRLFPSLGVFFAVRIEKVKST